MRHLLPLIALFARRRYRTIFAVAAIAVALSLVLTSRLEFDTDVLNLLPRKAPEMQTFRTTLEQFGSVDYLLIVVRLPQDAVLDPYEEYVERLGQRLEQLPQLGEVDYRLGEIDELIEGFLPQSILFLDPPARAELGEKLTDEALELRAKELRRLVTMPQALALKDLLVLDPLGLSELFISRLGSSRGGLKLDWSRGFFLSEDHSTMLLLAKPIKPPQDIDFDRELVAAIEGELAALDGEWSELTAPDELAKPEVALGGSYLIALDDATLIQRDAVVNLVTSMGGVLLLFLFAFRRLGLLIYAFVPLASGLALTFGLSALVYGRLSSATSGVAALLIGLGIDFVIVSYGRFVEERQRGGSLEDGLAKMSGASGRAVVIGAVTSAATFYAFFVTDFTGLLQMGFLTGTGILFCMVTVLFLLPAMLAWSEDKHRRRESQPRLFLHGMGSANLVRQSMRHPRAVLAVGGLVTAWAAWSCLGLEFEDSVKNMRPAGNRGVIVQDEVAEKFGSGFDYMMMVISGETVDEVIERAGEAESRAYEWIDGEILNGVDAVSSVIPPRARQLETLAWLDEHRAGLTDVERIRSTFSAALLDAGLNPAGFERGLSILSSALSPAGTIAVEQIANSREGKTLVARYLRETEAGWKSVVYLYPPARVWRREPPPQLDQLADSLGSWAELTGGNVVSRFMRTQVRADAVFAALLGFLLVGILLWLDYRRLDDTLLSLVPLLIGILWMLGALAALGLRVNFMNIFVTTMVIGIGVDYGVHMIHRYRESEGRDRQGLEDRLSETGKAIVLAALSTTVGFGSLSLSHYPGLKSMGVVAIIGALATCIVAVSLLPAYLALRAEE